MSDFIPTPIPDGKFELQGHIYMEDGKGGLQPVETIKPQHLLEDEMVRKVMGFTIAASEQVARLKAHTFEDIGEFVALLDQEYGITKGGKRGNMTFMTVDQLYMIKVQVQDRIDFGPELAIAKTLVDECLNEWAGGAGPELRAIVTDAFNTDKAGQINRNQIFVLLRRDIQDERWQRAMSAIRDAMRVVGSKTYVRSYQRKAPDAPWEAVTVDLAKA